ncbi:MAG: AbrB/MazE/SpoVT family DNA-binding domain-containing protein [Desulfobacterales bacterium]|nr:AbrB/MazE/SpoVT family DNA-binding domain-containing protein [Desulfobacterales bacterium]
MATSRVVDGWGLCDANNKNQKKGQFTIPGQFQKKSNIKEGTKVIIETRNNEPIIHPPVSDPIKEVSALFGKETLDSRELKMFAETSRVISKV